MHRFAAHHGRRSHQARAPNRNGGNSLSIHARDVLAGTRVAHL